MTRNVKKARRRIAAFVDSGGNTLDLSGLELGELPDDLFVAEVAARLQSLDLTSNKLTELPSRIGDLTALQTLHLGFNKLTKLPDRIGDLTALQSLNLGRNELTELPDRLFDLTALQSLGLWSNRLTELPERIGDLTALQSLGLWHNKLTKLPDRLFDLTALQSLDLGDNALAQLPDRVGDLTGLHSLQLWRNKITELPDQICDLSSGIDLNLFGNPLRTPPLKIGERGIKAVQSYFDLRDQDPGRYVLRSDLASLNLGRKSWMAVGETAVMTLVSLTLIYHGVYEHLWAGAALAPLLLLRTADSTKDALRRYRRLVKALHLKRASLFAYYVAPRLSRTMTVAVTVVLLPFKLGSLGIGSLAIKITTTVEHFFRFGWVRAMPENYRRQLTVVDLFSPSELVPGAEDAYGAHKQEVFTASDLLTDFNIDPSELTFLVKETYRKNPAVSALGFLFVGIFFLFAWAYRFSLKATCLIYWPFLFLHRDIGDDDLRRRLKESNVVASLQKSWVALFMLLVGAFGLVNLLGLAGRQETVSLVLTMAPEAFTQFLAMFPPTLSVKFLYTGCFLLALFYFASKILEFSISAKPIDKDEVWNRADTGTLRWMAKACYVGQNASICLVTAFVFVWGVPRLPEIASKAWGFFL